LISKRGVSLSPGSIEAAIPSVMSRAVAIVVAAGTSSRLGGRTPKQFRVLGGESVTSRSVRAIAACDGIDGVVVVVAADAVGGPDEAALRGADRVVAVVPGGSTRMASSLAGVEAAETAEFVLVHDAARPFVAPALVAAVLEATRRHGAAVPVLPPRDTVKREDGAGFVIETIDRTALRLAQTPQGARRDWLRDALRLAAASGLEVTDEAQALERAGRRVAVVPGDPANLKITTADDWSEALRRVDGDPGGLRVGHGYDVHRFGGARGLMLGGVAFPGEPGLAGHSDADVVLHGAMDAVLGAAGLPDIGHYSHRTTRASREPIAPPSLGKWPGIFELPAMRSSTSISPCSPSTPRYASGSMRCVRRSRRAC